MLYHLGRSNREKASLHLGRKIPGCRRCRTLEARSGQRLGNFDKRAKRKNNARREPAVKSQLRVATIRLFSESASKVGISDELVSCLDVAIYVFRCRVWSARSCEIRVQNLHRQATVALQ